MTSCPRQEVSLAKPEWQVGSVARGHRWCWSIPSSTLKLNEHKGNGVEPRDWCRKNAGSVRGARQ